MESLDNIHIRLNDIIEKNNWSGLNVDIIEKLIAEALYREQIGSVVSVYEGSRVRCKNTNSAIQHAMDLGYSVPRGSCRHIHVANLVPVQSMTVNKFDDAGTVGMYHLYYAHEYSFESNVMQDDVEFIVAKNVNEIEVSTTNEIYVDFIPISGIISSDYILYDVTDSNSPIDVTNHVSENVQKFFKEYSNALTGYQFFCQTFVDYSVRVYHRDISGRFGYNNNSYKLKYVEWVSDSEFSSDDIESISNFITDDGKPVVYREEPAIAPTRDKSLIYLNSLNTFKSNQCIKGNYDIKALVSEYFTGIICDCNPVYINSISGRKVVVYYTTYSGNVIPQSKISAFFNEVENTVGDISLQYAIPHQVSTAYNLHIVYSQPISSSVIQEQIDLLKRKIGGEFNPYQLITNIQNATSGIELIEFKSVDGQSLADISSIKLEDNEYCNIGITVSYSPYVGG